MESAQISFRRLWRAMATFVAVLLGGMVGFHFILDEGWIAAFYRSVVTTTLTGLDSPPAGTTAKLFSTVLLFAGVAIFLFIAGAIVEVIARGILSGAYTERRKRRVIDQMRDHTIICGWPRRPAGRVRVPRARQGLRDHRVQGGVDRARRGGG